MIISNNSFTTMEESDMFQKEGKAKGEGEGERGDKSPPTPSRLQKKAPRSPLQLDNNVYNNADATAANPSSSSGLDVASRCAIPLLSPLILAPLPSPESEDDKGVAESMSRPEHHKGNDDKKGGPGSAAPVPPYGGWKHPATNAPFTETSSLFSFFQSQCSIVHHHTQ